MGDKLVIRIPERLLELWERFSPSILDWRDRYTGKLVMKFCYQPETGEFLFEIPPKHHGLIIKQFGSLVPSKYVRGIYFRDKKTVYLRGHEREDWLKETEKMLRENGVGEDIRIIWGKEAAEELREELKEL